MCETTPYTLGSLFDGSGGFPLAGTLCGIEPRWASEVEPYPIAVTRERFPRVKHLGDISKINGAEIEPVDIITFGSPCQDLSVAGKRAGLKHEANGDEETTRSGLFMEAVRIIKEMRRATNGKYPRFALWENVPGAFSSNKGEDFRVVCEELIKIVEPRASMPEVPKNGWVYADSYIGDGWGLAYRTFDAQYWGVPQRRRRIHLIADFRGERAREVLFEREGVRGYFTQGRTPWQTTPANAEGSTGADDREGRGRGRQLDAVSHTGIIDNIGGQAEYDHESEVNDTLRAGAQGAVYYVAEVYDARGNGDGKTANTLTGDHNNRVTDYSSVICLQGNGIDRADTAGCNGKGWREDASYTLNTIDRPAVVYAVDQGGGKSSANIQENKAPTLCTTHGGEPVICMATQQGGAEIRTDDKAPTLTAAAGMSGNNQPVIALDRASFNQGQNAKYDFEITDSGVNSTIVARGPSAVAYKTPPRYIVRRLTPTECARLQGFADCWGHVEKKDSLTDEELSFWQGVRDTYALINDKPVKEYTEKQMLTWYNKLWTDSAEYKMWGNGIALPPALYCMQGIVDALNTEEEDDSWMM